MKKTVYICDRCGKEFSETSGGTSVEFQFGTYMDPAEGTKSDYKYIDLCEVCIYHLLKGCLKKLTELDRESSYNIFRIKIK